MNRRRSMTRHKRYVAVKTRTPATAIVMMNINLFGWTM